MGRGFRSGQVDAKELSRQDIAGARRCHLLLRRAELEVAPVRWRTLLEAIDVVPVNSPLRSAAIGRLVSDMTDPAHVELAGEIADEAQDPSAQAAVRLRQAELYRSRLNSRAAADIAWSLYESKRLPADRFRWLFERLASARQHDRMVRLVEDRLRSGKAVPQELLNDIAPVYELQGRPVDAKRARTNSLDFKPPPQVPKMQGGGMGGGFFSP